MRRTGRALRKGQVEFGVVVDARQAQNNPVDALADLHVLDVQVFGIPAIAVRALADQFPVDPQGDRRTVSQLDADLLLRRGDQLPRKVYHRRSPEAADILLPLGEQRLLVLRCGVGIKRREQLVRLPVRRVRIHREVQVEAPHDVGRIALVAGILHQVPVVGDCQ